MSSWFRKQNSPTVNQKQRLLSSLENGMIQASQQYKGYSKIGEVLHLQGPHISLKALSTAIGHLQRRHPVLRSRLQINREKTNSYFLEEDDTLQLRIREMPRKRADHMILWRQEWREREKETTVIGQGLAEFWLLQDPDDDNDDNSPREIVVICEHSVCDACSLSTVLDELLIALSDDNNNMFTSSLNWPETMEAAIQRSLSIFGKVTTLTRFILGAIYLRATNRRAIARIPVANVDFPLTDMPDHCHTETCYAVLNKEETQKLVEKCRQEGVTVTSAISTAILCSASMLVNCNEDQPTALHFYNVADTRRRYVPPIPNHDLSFHVSGMMPFIIPTEDISMSSEGMWQLAKAYGHHMKRCIDGGQILALGIIIGKIFKKLFGPPSFDELPTVSISSWGVLPFHEQYGRWKLIGMTPFLNMVRGLNPYITIQTVNGILTIMCVGNDPIIPLRVNIRLDKIASDPIFTDHLALLKRSLNDIIKLLDDPIFDRLYSEILPTIHHKIKWLDLEPLSMERVLLAVDYPNLHELSLFNIERELAVRLFGESHLNRIFKNQITTLNITLAGNNIIVSTSDIMNIVCTHILTMFNNLICLKFHPYADIYVVREERLSFSLSEPPTFFSSSLMELHINVEDFTDCLYLLDGRFKQLHTFYVDVHWFPPPSPVIINKVGYLN
ncbi:unnamed protein product [Rotaria sp. Silwood1]|nr:unnamed protein product [Rotaria sp. Silwood1]